MANMTNFDYYNFRIKYVTDKINEEIAFYEKYEYCTVHPFREYLLYLKNRLGIDKQEMKNVIYQDNFGNKCEIKKMNLDEYAKDMDILMFKRPWNKLKDFHKTMKMKEYIDHLEYRKKAKQIDITNNKKYLKEEICSGLKNKKFGKNKSEITYDEEKMNISSISCIIFNKKTGLYVVDWDS